MRVMILRTKLHRIGAFATMAGVCLPAWLLAAASHAGPATPGATAAPPAPEPAAVSVDAGTARRKLESSMAELGSMTAAAETSTGSDAQLAGCLLDKRDRGQEVMELATNELLVIQDGGSTDQQRQFATEKLDALATRMDQLVDAARQCTGDTGPEDDDDKTKNASDEPTTVPYADPTVGGGIPPVPPPVDDGRPPTVESPSG